MNGTECERRELALAASRDMEPVHGFVELDIPLDIFWRGFRQCQYWPRWNRCFFWVQNKELELGRQLIWAFEPIRPWYLYKLWSIAKMIEIRDQERVTWEVTAFPGMYARHTYYVVDAGGGRTRFGSWEKAMGPGFRWLRWFWESHFRFVKDTSLEGARRFEDCHRSGVPMEVSALPRRSYRGFATSSMILLVLIVLGCLAGWFYESYMRLETRSLAPGAYAVLGGGGNSLVLTNAREALLVDTKFPPASKWLYDMILRRREHVTCVVNTHYHYDHTEGNELYPEAVKVAHHAVPSLMLTLDHFWWGSRRAGLPSVLVPDSGMTLHSGKWVVLLRHPPAAHTSGDLYAVIPAINLVATGDLVFHGFYPFMDQPNGGTSIPGMIVIARGLATSYPTARFLPGHGPLATADDLNRYADYLECLYGAVIEARRRGWSEDQAAAQVRLPSSGLKILPSFRNGHLIWASARNNVRWAYRLAVREESRVR